MINDSTDHPWSFSFLFFLDFSFYYSFDFFFSLRGVFVSTDLVMHKGEERKYSGECGGMVCI